VGDPVSPPEEAVGDEDPERDPRAPCWCCGARPDPDFFQPTCGCVEVLCMRPGHRGELCRVCCDTLWQPDEFDEPDDDADLGPPDPRPDP
jgi:hypothetical protein